MRKIIFKAIKESVMASNAYGGNASRRDSPVDSVERDAPRPRGDQVQSAVQPAGSFEPHAPQNVPSDSAVPGRVLSVIGPSLVFKGKLFAEEDVLIQGRVEGSIRHSGANLTIGAHGEVKADIVAQKVIIQGKVHGDVRASETVVVESSARVQGNIFAPRIGLKEGAKFKGTIDMEVAAHETASRPGGGHSAGNATNAATAHASDAEELGGNKVDELLETP